MKNIFRTFVVILILTTPCLLGCQQGPSQATEEEGHKGMDNMTEFESASKVEEDTKTTP